MTEWNQLPIGAVASKPISYLVAKLFWKLLLCGAAVIVLRRTGFGSRIVADETSAKSSLGIASCIATFVVTVCLYIIDDVVQLIASISKSAQPSHFLLILCHDSVQSK
jgi:hypothetical protein